MSSKVKVSALARAALPAHFTAVLVLSTPHGPLHCTFCPKTQCQQILSRPAWFRLETTAVFVLHIRSFTLLQTHNSLIIENKDLITCYLHSSNTSIKLVFVVLLDVGFFLKCCFSWFEFQKAWLRWWRDGSAVKSRCCSCRGPKVDGEAIATVNKVEGGWFLTANLRPPHSWVRTPRLMYPYTCKICIDTHAHEKKTEKENIIKISVNSKKH